MRFTGIHRQLGVQPQVLTRQMIDDAVAARLPEQGDLDWKRARYDVGPDWQDEFAKDVAAMANSGGGLIVVGVQEDRPTSEADRVSSVAPLTDPEQRTYRQVAYSRVSPPVASIEFANLTAGDGTTVTAIWVPPSADMPHLLFRQTQFAAPFRDGTRTEWMREPQIQAAYRRRFDQRGDQREKLDDIFAQLISRSVAERRACFVAVAVPDTPRPPALGRVAVGVADAVLDAAIHVRAALAMPSQVSPLTDNSGQLSQFRAGPRRITARYNREEVTNPRYRSAEASIHDDGTVSMWWSLGGSLQQEYGQWGEMSSLFVEHAAADFVALLAGAARTLGIDSSYEVRCGLAFRDDQDIVIRAPDPLLGGHDRDASESIALRHVVPAHTGLPPQPSDQDALAAARDLALDLVSQAGVTQLHRLHLPA